MKVEPPLAGRTLLGTVRQVKHSMRVHWLRKGGAETERTRRGQGSRALEREVAVPCAWHPVPSLPQPRRREMVDAQAGRDCVAVLGRWAGRRRAVAFKPTLGADHAPVDPSSRHRGRARPPARRALSPRAHCLRSGRVAPLARRFARVLDIGEQRL